jgi:hypothetical protein
LGKEGQDLLLRIIDDEKKNIKPTESEIRNLKQIMQRKLKNKERMDNFSLPIENEVVDAVV